MLYCEVKYLIVRVAFWYKTALTAIPQSDCLARESFYG